jgi:hypothetical protein
MSVLSMIVWSTQPLYLQGFLGFFTCAAVPDTTLGTLPRGQQKKKSSNRNISGQRIDGVMLVTDRAAACVMDSNMTLAE